MVPLIVTFVLIAAVAFLIHKYLTWHYGMFKKLGIACPEPKVLVGNFPGKQNFVYEIDEIYQKYKKNHQVVGMFISREPQFLILDPKLAHEILVTNFKRFRDNLGKKFLYNKEEEKMASLNPFLIAGEEWKTRRTDVIGGVTQNKLTLAYPIWKSCVQKLSNLLKTQTAKGSSIIETKDLVTRFTSNVLGEFLWGIETNTLANLDERNAYLKMCHKIPEQVFQAFTGYYKYIAFPWLRRFSNYRTFPIEAEKFFSQLTKDAYALRDRDVSNKNRVDFLNYIRQLQEKKNLTHDEVVGYMGTALVDGFDTAASVGFHVLFYLTHHPDCQEKARKEILENLEGDGTISYQTLCGLPYLDHCVQETLRLMSPLVFTSRICTESTELILDDGRHLPIKEGQVVTIPAFSYTHDTEYFANPWKFKPERFENVDVSELIKRGVFLPFGDGPRICLGRHLATLQIKTVIAEILKGFRLKVCDQTPPEGKLRSQTLILGVEGDLLFEYERL